MTTKKEYELRSVAVHQVAGGMFLSGFIFGDGVRFEDGKFIYTSKIIEELQVADGVRYETNNSYYLVKDV